jgi:hypothetical protein
MSTSITIPVYSKEFIVTKTINNVVIRIINMKLQEFANISAIVRHNDDFIENYTFHVEGDDYDKWGSNDDFIIDYVLIKIGLIKKA